MSYLVFYPTNKNKLCKNQSKFIIKLIMFHCFYFLQMTYAKCILGSDAISLRSFSPSGSETMPFFIRGVTQYMVNRLLLLTTDMIPQDEYKKFNYLHFVVVMINSFTIIQVHI